MHDFTTRFDKSGRLPRPIQLEALAWLRANWSKAPVLAIQAPTGVGKSAIAEAVKVATGAAVVVPSNILIDQYRATYPTSNYLKGRTHYECHRPGGLTCDERREVGDKPCKGCPYNTSRRLALDNEPTFYNPISYHYLSLDKRWERPKVVVVDEAHKLKDMLLLLAGVRFRRGKYRYPDITNELQAVEWMRKQLSVIQQLIPAYVAQGNVPGTKELIAQRGKIEEALVGLESEPQNYAIYTTAEPYRDRSDEYLNIVPIEPPLHLVRRMMGAETTILMSATLPQSDVRALARGSPYLYLDLPSPIPATQRPVYFRPASTPLNYKTPPDVIAAWVKEQLNAWPGRNTLVHVTYELGRKLKPYFPGAFFNTKETKELTLEQFRAKGGVWFASGCAEGIDLPNDFCRLNLVPVLHYQNLGDPIVKKRLALSYGRLWYDMEALKTVIQQTGRSTRGVDDHSVTVIGDERFADLIVRNRQHIPRSFWEAIQWRKSMKTG